MTPKFYISTASILILSTISVYEFIEPPPKDYLKNQNQTPTQITPTPITQKPFNPEKMIKGDWSKDLASYQNYSQTPNYSPEQLRIIHMSSLLKGNSNDYKEYKKLCSQAKTQPQIGMTYEQSRMTTWCYPYERHVTKTSQGEYVQEVYLKPSQNNQEPDSRYSPRQYLYFQNGILVTIQE